MAINYIRIIRTNIHSRRVKHSTKVNSLLTRYHASQWLSTFFVTFLIFPINFIFRFCVQETIDRTNKKFKLFPTSPVPFVPAQMKLSKTRSFRLFAGINLARARRATNRRMIIHLSMRKRKKEKEKKKNWYRYLTNDIADNKSGLGAGTPLDTWFSAPRLFEAPTRNTFVTCRNYRAYRTSSCSRDLSGREDAYPIGIFLFSFFFRAHINKLQLEISRYLARSPSCVIFFLFLSN